MESVRVREASLAAGGGLGGVCIHSFPLLAGRTPRAYSILYCAAVRWREWVVDGVARVYAGR